MNDIDDTALPTLTCFAHSPDRGQGLARDMRVRWALEEVGQPYRVRLLTFEQMKQPAHLALNPFGQIPTYEEGGLVLFESGAIVQYLAETRPGLFPQEVTGRARAIAWMFAAVSSIEPPILELQNLKILEGDKPWSAERLPLVRQRIDKQLGLLSNDFGDRQWLDGDFSAGDIMMVHALQRLKPSGLLQGHANIAAYVARGEARPAYQRAFAAQLAVYQAGQPG